MRCIGKSVFFGVLLCVCLPCYQAWANPLPQLVSPQAFTGQNATLSPNAMRGAFLQQGLYLGTLTPSNARTDGALDTMRQPLSDTSGLILVMLVSPIVMVLQTVAIIGSIVGLSLKKGLRLWSIMSFVTGGIGIAASLFITWFPPMFVALLLTSAITIAFGIADIVVHTSMQDRIAQRTRDAIAPTTHVTHNGLAIQF